jgi:hypothetical protein
MMKSIEKRLDDKTKVSETASVWLTRKQASRYLQCSISALDSRFLIKKYYLNKLVRYLKQDLDEYLLAHCVEPNEGGKGK